MYMVGKPNPLMIRAALAALTFSGQMPPALLLLLAFELGVASAATTRAYQTLIPEIVPRSQLPAASSLGSISINVGVGRWPATMRAGCARHLM